MSILNHTILRGILKNKPYSRIALFIAVIVMFFASFGFYPKWKQPTTEATISWDVSGYYWYLPSIFIYKDLKGQGFKDAVLNKYGPTNNDYQQGMLLDNGHYVMKYSSGMAVMYLPFFAAAHILAAPLGYAADGFSPPYQLAIQLGGLLVAILGLGYLRKLLLLYYDDKVVAIALLLLTLCSNYLNYAAIDCGMSHSWLFTIYVLLLLNTHYLYQEFSTQRAVKVGALVGMAILTRPTEILSCMIPLLWGMETINLRAIKERMGLLVRQYKLFALAVLCAFAIVSIQLLYWKYVSGHWLVYSYGEQEFSWKTPHFYDYTFSYKSGWLVYSPVMVCAFVGLIPFLMHGRNKVAIVTFFLLNYYVVSAWDIWWYGGRAMVQSYPVLMLPVCALVAAALNRRIATYALGIATVCFLYYNTWTIVQYHGGGLYDSECMTKSYYWRVVGRWSAPERIMSLRDSTEVYEGEPMNQTLLYETDYTKDTTSQLISNTADGKKHLLLNMAASQTPVYTFAWRGKAGQWLRAEAVFYSTEKEWDYVKMPRFVMQIVKDNGGMPQIVKENWLRVSRLLDRGATKTILLDMQLPEVAFDTVRIYIKTYKSNVALQVRDIKVWSFTGEDK